MKTTLFNFKPYLKVSSIATILFLFIGCSKDDGISNPINPEAASINEYIFGLSYDPETMLNVQDTGGDSSERTLTGENTTDDVDQGTVLECQVKDYTLESNFDDVAILRPINGVIYPGALVVGNQGMLDGAPDPLSIDRAPVTLTVDLPGIRENGVIVVDNPENSSVQVGIDTALEWWNANAYEDDYVNAANSSYQAATSYSSTQLSLDVGLNSAWATGSIAAQMQYESSRTRRVATMVFKQVFYTVTMNTPASLNPSGVFGNEITLENVQSIIDGESPAAYVSSVNYGRIIMLRMETNNMNTSIDLDAVMNYATGVSSTTGTINAEYDTVLSNSTINIITIGGNAEVATSAVEAADIESGAGTLNYIITGENAVYSRDNPGVPIAYTIRYLKDNSIAKMGYTTDYTVEECGSYAFSHDEITVENNSYHDTRFNLRYKAQNSNIVYNSSSYELNQGDRATRIPPSGSHEVKIIFESQIGFGDFDHLEQRTLNYVNSDICYEFYGGSFGSHGNVRSVVCD